MDWAVAESPPAIFISANSVMWLGVRALAGTFHLALLNFHMDVGSPIRTPLLKEKNTSSHGIYFENGGYW